MKQFFKILAVITLSAAMIFLILNSIVKSPQLDHNQNAKNDSTQKQVKPTVHLVAVGDSLTYGVGDATKSGGYVPLVKQRLMSQDEVEIKTENFGVSGDTSTQIYRRVHKQKKIQKALQKADIITMTVGANDLMKMINKNVLETDLNKVNQGQKAYQKNLKRLMVEIRCYNPQAPVVVAGIYNPFYVYFPEIKDMMTSMHQWNQTTQEVLATFDHMYYVDIDQVMTKPKGSILAENQDKDAKTQSERAKEAYNPYLFDDDHFHPNNRGYQAIAHQFVQKSQQVKSQWLWRSVK